MAWEIQKFVANMKGRRSFAGVSADVRIIIKHSVKIQTVSIRSEMIWFRKKTEGGLF